MRQNNQNTGGGIGFLGGLTLLFIALKLMGYINWSWWWVLAPMWVPFIIIFICGFIDALTDKRRF